MNVDSERRCCPDCIGDRHLRRQVIPSISTGSGDCSYCGHESEWLVHPSKLRDAFELVRGIYIEDKSGPRTLGEWFKSDWAMFEKLDGAHIKDLLGDILEDGEIVRRRFVPSDRCQSNALQRWQDFREELMHQNRFFPKTGIDLDVLQNLLPYLLLDDSELLNRSWYRARIQAGNGPLPPEQMGAPPSKKATHGRANPAGIPYLYLASAPQTAVSEIRPHTGESCSVAEFSIPKGLKVLDLANPRRAVSPFIPEDENDVAVLRGYVEFLERLGEELTRPVLRQSAAIDYTPCQYLCEFIKKCGYHGLIYRSSVGEGVNLALFDPDSGSVGTVVPYRVTWVSVNVEAE